MCDALPSYQELHLGRPLLPNSSLNNSLSSWTLIQDPTTIRLSPYCRLFHPLDTPQCAVSIVVSIGLLLSLQMPCDREFLQKALKLQKKLPPPDIPRLVISPPDIFHCCQTFPPNNCTQVCPLPNPKPVPANRPNLEAKRPPKPLIVTSLCKLNTKSCLNQVSCGGGREEKRTNIRLRCRFRTPLLRMAPSTWFPSTWVRIKYKPFLVVTHIIVFS